MRGPARSAAVTRALRRDPSPPSPLASGRAGTPFSRSREKVAGASRPDEGTPHTHPGALLASAYPERIAMARGKRGEFLMANGRAAALEPHDALAGEAFLAIGEVAGRAASARILLAAPLTPADIETVAGASIETAEELTFDRASAALRARRRRRLGALMLADQTLAVPPDERSALALALGVLWLGVERLPLSEALRQWRGRVMFLRRAEGEGGPTCRTTGLAQNPEWLAPFLLGKTRLEDIGADELSQALRAMLPRDCRAGWTTRRRPISAPRRERPRRSTTKRKAARRSRYGCRSCLASANIRRSPADASH